MYMEDLSVQEIAATLGLRRKRRQDAIEPGADPGPDHPSEFNHPETTLR